MAKLTGPLFSMDASGAFADAIVFSKWKGRNTARRLVTPSNPRTSGQELARNRMRVMGRGMHFAATATTVRSGQTVTDQTLITQNTPSGQAWNGHLIKSGIGTGGAAYTAAAAAYTALQAGDKTAWDTAAGALSPPFLAAPQTVAGGGSTTAISAGQCFFHYIYTLYLLGVATVPGATPPTYA